jgi:hypothetical protein
MENLLGISPEELLRSKELMGGLEYDPIEEKKDTVLSVNNLQEESSNEIQIENNTNEHLIQEEKIIRRDNSRENTLTEDKIIYEEPVLPVSKEIKKDSVFEIHWKNLPIHLLPSEGRYYPEGTRMAIRPSDVKEIRHFSTIDEDDSLDIERKLSFILERCLRIDFPGEGVVSYKDLKQEDRFYIIMAIRDLTFLRGENSLMLTPNKKCENTEECKISEGFELRSGNLSSYELDPEILKRYNPETRSFVFTLKDGSKTFEMFVPSIGVTQVLSSFMNVCSTRGIQIEDGFLEIAPFIIPEWRGLSFEDVLSIMKRTSLEWDKKDFSLLYQISEKIKIGTKTEAKQKCLVCGEGEVTAEITFPGGIRSLFLISDIFRELL